MNRDRLARKERVVSSLLAQQADRPGYCADIMMALVDSELALLVVETERLAVGPGHND